MPSSPSVPFTPAEIARIDAAAQALWRLLEERLPSDSQSGALAAMRSLLRDCRAATQGGRLM